MRSFLPGACVSVPGRKDLGVLLIGGAICGASRVRDYTTPWVLAVTAQGTPHAPGLALSLLNALLQLSHCATRTLPILF